MGERHGGKRGQRGARPRKGGKDYGLLLLQSLGILGVVVSSDSLRYPAPILLRPKSGHGSPRFGEFHHDARHGFPEDLQRARFPTDGHGLRGGRRGETGTVTGGRHKKGGIRFPVDGHGLGGTAGNGGGGRIGPVGAWGEAAAPSTLPPLGRLAFRTVRTRAISRNPRRRTRSTTRAWRSFLARRAGRPAVRRADPRSPPKNL